MSGLTMKMSGISLASPGASACWLKQKHSILSKCCAAWPGVTLGTAWPVMVRFEVLRTR